METYKKLRQSFLCKPKAGLLKCLRSLTFVPFHFKSPATH